MQNDRNEIHVSSEDARAGSTPGTVRYVLAISLILAIAALTAIWMTGAVKINRYNNAQSDAPRPVVAGNVKG